MEPEKKKLLSAIALAVVAAATAWAYLYARERQLLSSAEELKVLVAKRYIPATTRLEGGSLAWQRIPRAFVPQGAITDGASALGLQTLVPFNAGEPILYNKLAEQGQALAASVPEGKRAISLPINAVSGISGLLRPGDHVDVMLLYGPGNASQAGIVLQDINVLAVGGNTSDHESKEATPTTITLALSPEDASLALVAAAQGQLHLALRATGDARPASPSRSAWGDVLRRLERPVPAAKEAASTATAATEDFIPHKR